MGSSAERVIVVGGGVFGLTAAVELRRRGRRVTLLEKGAIPNPVAASTDVSKLCRMEYGPDEEYMAWMELAREGWLEWNRRWIAGGKEPLYHEDGVLFACLDRMAPGGFEHDSFRTLQARGHSPERLGGAALASRFPAWPTDFVDGFYHRLGGWAESGRVVERLAEEAAAAGVELRPGVAVAGLLARNGRVAGVRLADGRLEGTDDVVLAAGSWSGELLPHLSESLRRSYHPVWHLVPRRPELFEAHRFPPFAADVARTGYYGFPLHPREGVVKIGHHGAGVMPALPGRLVVPAAETERLLEFLGRHLPALADATVASTRLCPYCDTQDENFWIAADPQRPGLTLATGGSGHGFKFAPLLGDVIADTVEGRSPPSAARFAWRPGLRLTHGSEAARCRAPGGGGTAS